MNIYGSVTQVKVTARLRTLPIEDAPGYCVWKTTRRTVHNRDGESFSSGLPSAPGSEEGIVLAADIAQFVSGKIKSLPQTHIRAVKNQVLDLMAKYGWGEGWDRAQKAKLSLYEEKPFTLVEKGLIKDYSFVQLIGSSHLIFNIAGNPLPVGQYFSYIDGQMDNAHYDLPKAVEILQKCTNIEFIAEDRWHDIKKDGIIQKIPYYNASRGRDKQISFIWRPSPEEMQRVYDECLRMHAALPDADRKRRHKSMSSCSSEGTPLSYCWVDRQQAMFNIDILGLRAGGAALFEDFYKSAPYHDDDEDDDE